MKIETIVLMADTSRKNIAVGYKRNGGCGISMQGSCYNGCHRIEKGEVLNNEFKNDGYKMQYAVDNFGVSEEVFLKACKR